MARRKDLTAWTANEIFILEVVNQFFVMCVEQASFANLCQRYNMFVVGITTPLLLQFVSLVFDAFVFHETGTPSLVAATQPFDEARSVQLAPQFSANYQFHALVLNCVEEIFSRRRTRPARRLILKDLAGGVGVENNTH